MKKILGIDFGTCNCRAAVMDLGKLVLIRNTDGDESIPSAVAFVASGFCVVGKNALEIYKNNPEQVVMFSKTKLGSEEVYTDPWGIQHPMEEIAAILICQLKKNAEAYLGDPVHDAVVAVPCVFNMKQVKALEDAVSIAGMKCTRVIRETDAIALYQQYIDEYDEKFMVVDIGSGYISGSIVEKGDGVTELLCAGGYAINDFSDHDVSLLINKLMARLIRDNGGMDDTMTFYAAGGNGRKDVFMDAIRWSAGGAAIAMCDLNAVAYGTALEAAKMNGDAGAGDILLLEILPHNYYVRTAGSGLILMLEKNYMSRQKTISLGTSMDLQDSISVDIIEQDYASDRIIVGELSLTSLPRRRKGVISVDVKLEYDPSLGNRNEVHAVMTEKMTNQRVSCFCGEELHMGKDRIAELKVRVNHELTEHI